MTKNDVRMLKAKKELLERQITALEEEVKEKQEEIKKIEFWFEDEAKTWNENKNKLNKLVKETLPLLEIKDYLFKVLDSIEQSDLDEYKENKSGEDEGE
ncbi:hypothetical protein KO465_01405 [Candidatus Micrarchaeota archaeon]|jgi:flagellar biosynthesis chaperone FliJ|nr:hypothetical protein [Candidatus Micrarchaeota archaeon]